MCDVDFNFMGMDVNCDYDEEDQSINSCRNQDCEIYEQTLSDYYLELLQETMSKAIKVKTESKKLDIDLSNNKNVNDKKLSLGIERAA